MMLGSIGGGTLADHPVITLRYLRGVFLPEDRLKAAWLSALISQLGTPLYCWTIHFALPWPDLIPASVMVGFCNFLLQTVATTYLVDIYTGQAAAMVSVLNCMRWIFGAVAPILSVPGYQLGVGWYFTLIGAVNGITAGLMMCVAFLPWFALDELKKEPWVVGEGREKQVEAVKKGGEGIEWGVVLWGGGRFRQEAVRAKKEDMEAKAEKRMGLFRLIGHGRPLCILWELWTWARLCVFLMIARKQSSQSIYRSLLRTRRSIRLIYSLHHHLTRLLPVAFESSLRWLKVISVRAAIRTLSESSLALSSNVLRYRPSIRPPLMRSFFDLK
jgi:MFS family permease